MPCCIARLLKANSRGRHHVLHKPVGLRMGQCRDGKLLFLKTERTARRTYRTQDKAMPMYASLRIELNLPKTKTAKTVVL
jgi:hypothetical protein